MKKIRLSALALAGVMSLSLLTACGGKADPTPTPEQSATPPVAETTETPEATQPAESVTPSAEPSTEATPEVTADPTVEPTVQPTPAPTPTPEATPEPTPEPAADASVADIWAAIEGEQDLPSLMDLDDDLLSDLYGINAADLEEYVAKMPLMNVHATEFFLAKVKPGKMSAVKDGISARLDDLKGQWERYLPDQLELVNNAQVVESGDYILFCVAEDAKGAVELFQDYTK